MRACVVEGGGGRRESREMKTGGEGGMKGTLILEDIIFLAERLEDAESNRKWG